MRPRGQIFYNQRAPRQDSSEVSVIEVNLGSRYALKLERSNRSPDKSRSRNRSGPIDNRERHRGIDVTRSLWMLERLCLFRNYRGEVTDQLSGANDAVAIRIG